MNKKSKKKVIIIAVSILVLVIIISIYILVDKNKLYVEKARDYYTKGLSIRAYQNYKEASKYWFLNNQDRFQYAVSSYGSYEYEESIRQYDKLLKNKYDTYNSLNGLGNSYRVLGDMDKAIEYYEKAIQYDKTKKIAYMNIIYSLYFNGLEYENYVKKAFENINEKDYLDIYHTLFDVYRSETDQKKTLDMANKIIQLDPNNDVINKYLESHDE